MDLKVELNRVIRAFLIDVGELARLAVIDTLASAFAHGGARSTTSVMTLAAGPRSSRGGKKRAQSELSELSAKFAAFVEQHPGLRIEQINKQIGTTTKDLTLPIRRLIEKGVIKTQNRKRSTTYYPGASGKLARA